MRSVQVWDAKILDKDNVSQCVYDVVLKPDEPVLLVAAGTKVLVYDTVDGRLIQTLKGHNDLVYCLCYAKDGQRFASGSADKQVIIWTSKLEAILRYSHHDAIQCLAYNPTSHQLTSCACSDFGMWSPEQKSVTKHRTNGRITSCSWTSDGLLLALGFANGYISIRGRNGDEKVKVERPGGQMAPVWALCWNPEKDENGDSILAVTDWGQTLSFYNSAGKQVGKERSISFDALRITYLAKGNYLLICGSNRQVSLYTKEGIFIGPVAEMQSWVWCCSSKAEKNYVALGCEDGTVAYYEVGFSTVHSLYKERYAYRENITDVVIQHLISEEKVRIKCRDLVKKIAIYKHRLAVQIPDRIVIYELAKGDFSDMHYKVKEKINQKVTCTLLVVCANHIVLCQEKRLQCMSFQGMREREWVMESAIRYIKVTGGPPGSECLLLGLRDGQVMQIFLDNQFPLPVLKVPSAVRCLDISAQRKKLAVVDDSGTVLVYDILTKELLFTEPNANSVAWNSLNEDMLCFSGAGFLNMKAGNFPVLQQKLQGFVVGFCACRIFCLHFNTMTTMDVPQSSAMYQYIDKKLFSEAYEVACLGVTDADWKFLGVSALENLNLKIARQAFIRTRDIQILRLIQSFEDSKKNHFDMIFLGDVHAYLGKFPEAANFYKKSGHESKAMTMYTDLRMFDMAQEFLGSQDLQDKKILIKKKADWAKNINEPKAAAEMYLSAGEISKAIEIIGQHGYIDMLVDVGEKIDKADHSSLSMIAEHLRKYGQFQYASAIYRKMGNTQALIKLSVEAKNWDEAFALADQHPNLKEDVFVPYANWLAENDRFVEAQSAFHKAGRQDEALRVLEELTKTAINEKRFKDAGYYYFLLSMQCLDIAKNDESQQNMLINKFWDLQHKAEIYYVYHNIERYLDEPFTALYPEALFNMARYLVHNMVNIDLPGVSKVSLYYALAKQSLNMKAYKLARYAYNKLQSLRIPKKLREPVDLGAITLRAKPFSDAEDLLPLCYRCSTTNPLLNKQGNFCINCKQPFVHSFVSFEILPVIEFHLEEDIKHEEAISLLQSEPLPVADKHKYQEENSEDYQALTLDNSENIDVDPFTSRLMNFEEDNLDYAPVTVNRSVLRSMNFSDVIICDWPPPLRHQYFRNLLPEIIVRKCRSCFKLFHGDDYELQILQSHCCPFCRYNPEEVEKDVEIT